MSSLGFAALDRLVYSTLLLAPKKSMTRSIRSEELTYERQHRPAYQPSALCVASFRFSAVDASRLMFVDKAERAKCLSPKTMFKEPRG
jgi:hypothetical protein